MKKTLISMFGILFSTTLLYAAVGELSWSGKTSWTYNKEIMGDKPGDQWDAQKTDQEANPIKWVLHKSDANPVIWLRVDDTTSNNTDSTQMAADLRSRYESRGISVNTVQEKMIGGQKVYIVSGLDKAKAFRYSAAVFPRGGTKRAYHVELTAPEKDFSTYEPAYMGMVQTIRLLPVATSSGY